jgi:hypothetical protein
MYNKRFNALESYNGLIEAGCDDKIATATIEAINNAIDNNIVTKGDLLEVQIELTKDIADVKSELKQDIADVKSDIAAVRQEMAAIENRLLIKLGSLIVGCATVIPYIMHFINN